MSVEESIVILAPMSQVGCLSASAHGDRGELLARVAPEGAAARGEHELAGPRSASPARSAW